MGDRPDVRGDVGRGGLRVLHRRRVLADDRRLARRRPHAHADGPRRDRDGPLEPRAAPPRAALPLRCRIAVHLDPLRRAARGDRRGPVDRNGRRQLRQRAGRDGQRLLQGRADPRPRPHRPVEDRSRRSSSPRSAGCTGTTPSACTATSATCRPPSSKQLHAARERPQDPDPGDLSVASGRSAGPQIASQSVNSRATSTSEIASEIAISSPPQLADRRRSTGPRTPPPGQSNGSTDNNINTNNMTADTARLRCPPGPTRSWPNHKTPEPPSNPGRFSACWSSAVAPRRTQSWRARRAAYSGPSR